MKIVYCNDNICVAGGVQVVTIVKANALARIPGNQVWIVVADNPSPSCLPLKDVSVIDLGIHYYEHDTELSYVGAVIDFFRKKRLHRQRLQRTLEELQPDVVISTDKLTKYMVAGLKLPSRPVFIREIHHVLDYSHRVKGKLKQFIAKVGEVYDYQWKIKAYDKIVVLTEEGKAGAWEHWDKVAVIPNPLTNVDASLPPSTQDSKLAVATGRLVYLKNHASLVRVWAKVTERHPDWKLQIWGEGPEEAALRRQIAQLGLEGKVELMGVSREMVRQMSHASLHLLSSLSEGFSLVALEAMSVGVPTVAYDCQGGLRYVVKDGETGVFVPMGDEEAFATQVCRLIEDEALRKRMGKACLDEVERYKVDYIALQWMALFEEELAKKRG